MSIKNNGTMIDIIVPCYNSHQTIEIAINSIITQLNINQIQVTLIDDGSDYSYEYIIEKYKNIIDIQLLKLEQNYGIGYVRQYGLDNTYNPYIIFLDSDDVFFNVATVKILLTTMENNPSCVVCSGSFLHETEDNIFININNSYTWIFAKIYRRSFLNKYKIKFNNTRYQEDGAFNTQIRINCDGVIEYMSVINEILYVQKYNKNSLTNNTKNQLEHFINLLYYYIDNIYTVLQNDYINEEQYKYECLSNITYIYFYCMRIANDLDYYYNLDFDKIKAFYQFILSKYDDIFEYEFFNDIYNASMEAFNFQEIPYMNLQEFLNFLEIK